MTNKVEELVYALLTTNTGRALGDSGDAYGRHWQRNQNKTIDDFRNEPEATLEVSHWQEWADNDLDVTISLFHKLTSSLDLDELCDEFNALPVDDWDGDYYGTSVAGCEWLEGHGFTPEGNGFNSYNGESNLSQVIQGQLLSYGGYVDRYLLLQIHNGCDVRGGYTDAKLFKVDEDRLWSEYCSFDLGDERYIDCYGYEFTDTDGSPLDRDQLNDIPVGKYVGHAF